MLSYRAFEQTSQTWMQSTIVTRQASGEEISRISDIAMRPGQREILNAFSAARLRKLPATRVRVTVTGRSEVANGRSPSTRSSTAGRSIACQAGTDVLGQRTQPCLALAICLDSFVARSPVRALSVRITNAVSSTTWSPANR